MPARTLEETILDLVHSFAADLVPLVRQAALDAAREALVREGRVKPTRVVEITPAAPPVAAATRNATPTAAKAAPPSMPRQFSGADSVRLDDAILRHLAAHPGLRAEEITKGLFADPVEVKRALVALRAGGRVRTEGQKRGMRYSNMADGPVPQPRPRAEARQESEAAEENAASVAEA